MHTPRNEDILLCAAETFRDAVVQFTNSDSPLRYKWVKYLPGTQSLGGAWDILPSSIFKLLEKSEILYSEESPIPCLPSMLRTLPESHWDSSGQPLFHDLPGRNRKYLSRKYDREDIEILGNVFNLRDIEDLEMYDRIQQDLESSSSKMKDDETDHDWHSKAASLILLILSRSSPSLTNMIRELPLVPLNNGDWVDPSGQQLYLAAQTGPKIPQDILITVDPRAAENSTRRTLFKKLGVTNISPVEVVDRLFTHYLRHDGASDLASSIAHVSYLYWHLLKRDDPRLSLVWLYDETDRKVTSRRNLMYFQTPDKYGPSELLTAYEHPTDPSRNIPGCPVSFLKSQYTSLFSPETRRNGSSWMKWLEKGLGVRRIPRLKFDAGSLSTEFRHIIQYRPDKVVGLLKEHWDDYEVDMSPPIKDILSKSMVACLGEQLKALKDTYLPLPDLKEKARELGVEHNFPFLKVSDHPDDLEASVAPQDWRFLWDFEVGFELDLNFYVETLRQHRRHNDSSWGNEIIQRILSTYEHITENCSDIQIADLRYDPTVMAKLGITNNIQREDHRTGTDTGSFFISRWRIQPHMA